MLIGSICLKRKYIRLYSKKKNCIWLICWVAGEKLGLATSPPYLSLISKGNKNENNASFINGVSFASAGAGIFDGTDERYVSHQFYILLNEE